MLNVVAVAFTVHDDRLWLLHGDSPNTVLPVTTLDDTPDPDRHAEALCKSTLALRGHYREQLYTFGACPAAGSKGCGDFRSDDPHSSRIDIAYLVLVRSRASGLPAYVPGHQWQPVSNALPVLGDKDRHIARFALDRLRSKLGYSTIVLKLVPKLFTLTHLQRVHEAVAGSAVDKRNFRKRVRAWDCLVDSDQLESGAQHRPARLYRARSTQVQIVK